MIDVYLFTSSSLNKKLLQVCHSLS